VRKKGLFTKNFRGGEGRGRWRGGGEGGGKKEASEEGGWERGAAGSRTRKRFGRTPKSEGFIKGIELVWK